MPRTKRQRSHSLPPMPTRDAQADSRTSSNRIRTRTDPGRTSLAGRKTTITKETLERRFPVQALRPRDQPSGTILNRPIAGGGNLSAWKDETGNPRALLQSNDNRRPLTEAVDDIELIELNRELIQLWGDIEALNEQLGVPEGALNQILVNATVEKKEQAIERIKHMIAAVNERDPHIRLELMEINVTKAGEQQRILNFQIAKRPKRSESESVVEKIHSGEILLKTISRDPTDPRSQNAFTEQMKVSLKRDAGQRTSTDADLFQNYRWAPFIHNLSNPRLGREAMREPNDAQRDMRLRAVGEPGEIKGPPPGTVKIDPRSGKASAVDRQQDISENVYRYTRKTAMSLVPKSGKMAPYESENSNATVTGLLFDVHKSDLKDEKYVFADDAETDSRWWIKDSSDSNATNAKHTTTTLDNLRNPPNGKTSYSEILAGLNLEGVAGVFYAPGKNRADLDQLQAIARRQLLRSEMRRTVPLLEITPSKDPEVRSPQAQLDFLNELLANHKKLDELLAARFAGELFPPDRAAKIEAHRQQHIQQIKRLQAELEAEIAATTGASASTQSTSQTSANHT